MKLSLITPYYNTLEYTKKLASVLVPQLGKDVEWIIVDDGCNEKWLDTLENANVKVIHNEKPSGGAGKPRNIGINKARGEYIGFIDSDDMVTSDYVEKILEHISYGKDYILLSWKSVGIMEREVIIDTDPPKWNTCVWNTVYKKELIGKNRFDENKKVAEDEDFNARVRNGSRDNIKDVIYIYSSGRIDGLTSLYGASKDFVKASLLIYQKYVSKIGGIETFLYNFFLLLHDKYDITFVYEECDSDQLLRYMRYVKCVRDNGQRYVCSKYICASNQKNIADRVYSSENFYGMMIHADFDAMGWTYKSHKKTTINIAVSELAKKGIEKQSDLPCIVIYNLLELNEPKKVVHFISATRMSKEKGEDVIRAFDKRLYELGKLYTFDVYTDNLPSQDGCCNLRFKPSTLDVESYVCNADYYFDSSSTESYGYSDVLALSHGIPLVAIDKPIFEEIGVEDGKNAYILKPDLSNMDEVIEKIYANEKLKFEYAKKDNKQQWIDLLGDMPKLSDYKYGDNSRCVVECIITFTDTEAIDPETGKPGLKRTPTNNYKIFECSQERYRYLSGGNPEHLVAVKLIGMLGD